MLDKIFSFITERTKWIKAGKPIRSDEKIKELFIICSSNECGQYIKHTEESGNCGVCGCRLKIRSGGLNKLAWGTTKCPLEDPKWIEEEEYRNIVVTEEEMKEIKVRQTKKQKVASELPPDEPTPPDPPRRRGCGCGG